MAKRRGRTVSLDGLVAALSELDRQRKAITDQLRAAIGKALSDVPSPFSTGLKRGRPAGSKNVALKGARKRRKMSAAARAKISAAQKKRWAKMKA